MADIKVEPQARMVDPFGKLQILPKLFDEQPRLRLDKERHAHLRRHIEAGHDLVVENVGGLLAGLPLGKLPTWLGGDRGGAKFGGQPEGPLGVLAPDGPVVAIGIGPAGMPVGLPRIGNRIHHEGVDIRDLQAA